MTLMCLGSVSSSGLMSGGGLFRMGLFGLLSKARLVNWVWMCLVIVVLFGAGGRVW